MLRAFACAPSPSQRRALFVVAATNRPELIDAAMLRPGRLDKLLYVPLPTPDERASILSALARLLFTARFFTTVKASSEEKVSSETESAAPREERRRFFNPVDPDASFSFAAFFPRR